MPARAAGGAQDIFFGLLHAGRRGIYFDTRYWALPCCSSISRMMPQLAADIFSARQRSIFISLHGFRCRNGVADVARKSSRAYYCYSLFKVSGAWLPYDIADGLTQQFG